MVWQSRVAERTDGSVVRKKDEAASLHTTLTEVRKTMACSTVHSVNTLVLNKIP